MSVKTLNDITVNQLIEIQGMDTSSLSGQKLLLKVLYGVDADNLPLDEFLELCGKAVELFNTGDKTFKQTVEVGGVTFHAKELTSFSTREFIDFDTLAKDGKENFRTILALIYGNDEFDGMEYVEATKKKAEILGNMDAGTALGAIDFFTKALLQYVNNTLLSSAAAKKLMEKNPEMRKSMNLLQTYLAGAGN